MILIHAASFLTVNIMVFTAWYDVLSVLAALLFVLSVAQSDPRYYRLLFISNSSLWIVYDLLSRSYANLFTHIVVFVGVLISIIIKNKKQS